MNIYTLMRAQITFNFILFDLYNDETHTNFEVKLCISRKRCVNANILKEKVKGYMLQKAYLEGWLKILELIDTLYFIEK